MAGNELVALSQLKENIQKYNSEKKKLKDQYDPLEEKLVHELLALGKAYVDKSGTGTGPFLALTKKQDPASFTNERQKEFFTLLIPEIQQARVRNADDCMVRLKSYLQHHSKRKIVIEEVVKQPSRSIEDLRAFKLGMPGTSAE